MSLDLVSHSQDDNKLLVKDMFKGTSYPVNLDNIEGIYDIIKMK